MLIISFGEINAVLFWIIIKVAEIIVQRTYISWTETESHDRWKIIGLMGKDLWENPMKDVMDI